MTNPHDFRSIRPAAGEYADYYGGYINAVPDGDIIRTLGEQRATTLAFLRDLPAAKQTFRYAPGKWSIKEVVGHLVDCEWVFTNRALRFARADQTPLPGIDQDVLMAGANFDARPFAGMLTELDHLRSANLALFESFDAAALARTGVASNFEVSVRAIIWIIAGHTAHHMRVIRERYLA